MLTVGGSMRKEPAAATGAGPSAAVLSASSSATAAAATPGQPKATPKRALIEELP